MKAVILAAGRGTRLAPLTDSCPKSLVLVNGKPLLEYTLDMLVGLVDEVIIVVGHLGELVESHFGSAYNSLLITYVRQSEQLGTGHALLCAKDHLRGKFIVLNGDDIFSRSDIEKLIKHDYALLTKRVADPSTFAAVTVKDGLLDEIVEKPKTFVSDLASVGVYCFTDAIFFHELVKSSRGEYEIPDYVSYAAKKFGVHVEVISEFWYPINTHEQLASAAYHLKRM